MLLLLDAVVDVVDAVVAAVVVAAAVVDVVVADAVAPDILHLLFSLLTEKIMPAATLRA